jgi:hypothetical protein
MRRKRSVTEADSVSMNTEKKSAGLVVGIRASIDDDSVAWMKWSEHFLELDPVGSSPCYFPRERATLFPKASVNELLMVHAMEPAGEKAPTESHLESVFVFFGGGGGVIG